jgi:hypothetical protein
MPYQPGDPYTRARVTRPLVVLHATHARTARRLFRDFFPCCADGRLPAYTIHYLPNFAANTCPPFPAKHSVLGNILPAQLHEPFLPFLGHFLNDSIY